MREKRTITCLWSFFLSFPPLTHLAVRARAPNNACCASFSGHGVIGNSAPQNNEILPQNWPSQCALYY